RTGRDRTSSRPHAGPAGARCRSGGRRPRTARRSRAARPARRAVFRPPRCGGSPPVTPAAAEMLVAIAALIGQQRQARGVKLPSQPELTRVLPCVSAEKAEKTGRVMLMLTFGVVVLGVTDRPRAERFWSAALGYRVREGGFGGWSRVLEPPDGPG